MSERMWDSDVCVCGHFMHYHYRKNYLGRHPIAISYGNVDHHGCERCEAEGKICSHIDDGGGQSRRFKHLKVPQDFWAFENDFPWDIKDKDLLALYNKEVIGTGEIPLMKAYVWVLDNETRYLELLAKAGVDIEKQRGETPEQAMERERIRQEVAKEMPLANKLAEEVAIEIDTKRREMGLKHISKGLIRELVKVKMLEMEMERRKQA